MRESREGPRRELRPVCGRESRGYHTASGYATEHMVGAPPLHSTYTIFLFHFLIVHSPRLHLPLFHSSDQGITQAEVFSDVRGHDRGYVYIQKLPSPVPCVPNLVVCHS